MSASLVLSLVLLGHPPAHGAGVRWEQRFEDAMKKARSARKPVMVDFWAEWCGWCHRLDQTTYVDPTVTKLSHDFVAVKVDTEGGRKQTEIALKYNVSTLPTIIFLTAGGRQVLKVGQFQGPGQFPKTMEAAREAATRVMAWEAALEKDPHDSKALFLLGRHMFEQEFYEESRDLLYRAAAADTSRPVGDRKQARMLLGIIQKYDNKNAEAEKVLKEALAIQPPTEYDPKMLYILGRVYMAVGRPADARGAMNQVLTYGDTSVTKKAKEALKELDK
jgi:thioredoxin-like negative regulator of GroEL